MPVVALAVLMTSYAGYHQHVLASEGPGSGAPGRSPPHASDDTDSFPGASLPAEDARLGPFSGDGVEDGRPSAAEDAAADTDAPAS